MPSESPGDPCVQVCPNCAALVDVREQEPLAKFHCPTCGTAMRASRQYNHFSVVEVLGQGGMGTVFKALDRNLNRMVALKLLRRELSDEEGYIVKLEDEARITASINHPYVVKVFSFGSDHGQYYIAMELVDKGSLDDLMQLQGRISELQVLHVGLQVASGLQAAHEAGLIHRDVKPGNILFADARTAKITDFGLALPAEQAAESRGEIWGTPYYIAPEKLNNQPEDFRSDMYSLGGTLFHAVAGRPPFEAESASLVALKHLKSKAVSLQAFAPDVSGETAYVINRMLHKDPGERYATYGELLDHFKYAIDTLAANAAKPRAPKQRVVVESENQSNIAGLLTLLLVVLLVAGGISAYIFRDHFGTPKSDTPTPINPKTVTSGEHSEAVAAYEDARHDIVAGRYADAKANFDALLQRSDLVQPTLNWTRLHQGFVAILNNEVSGSHAIFGSLSRSGLFTKDPAQLRLANFFLEAGRFLANTNTIPAKVAKSWNKNNFENMALLLFGLKDWAEGDFDDANALLETYLSGKPEGAYAWISDYQPIARHCVHDYALYAPLRDKMKAPGADRAAVRGELVKARGQLETSGKMVETFFAAEAELDKDPGPPASVPAARPNVPSNAPESKPAATAGATPIAKPSPTATPVSPAHDAERLRWQTTRDSYRQQVALYHFDEAQAVLTQAPLSEPDFVRARNLTLARAKNMLAFKKMLIADINNHRGYPKPVTSRRGNAYPRGIVKAGSEEVEAATPYGTIGVPWTDFAPQALLGIAAYYTDATTQPSIAAERRWWAANFALECGLLTDAKSLANRAAQDQPGYRSDLGQFEGTIGTAAPLPPSRSAP